MQAKVQKKQQTAQRRQHKVRKMQQTVLINLYRTIKTAKSMQTFQGHMLLAQVMKYAAGMQQTTAGITGHW